MTKQPPPSKFLKTHRSVVSSTRGMSTGILLGSSFAVATGGLGWLGHLGDVKYGTEPWLAVGGILLGFVYGGYEVWKLVRLSDADGQPSENGADHSSPIPTHSDESSTPPRQP